MNIVAFPNPSGSRYWRLEDPFKYLSRNPKFNAQICTTGIEESVAQWADVYVLQGVVDKDGLALLYAYQQEFGKKIVVEQDDNIEVEDDNVHKIEHEKTDAYSVIKRIMEVADGITTTTEYLARKLYKHNQNVAVLPNYLDLERWDLPKKKNDSTTIRIGWAGSATHLKDMEMVEKPIKRILEEFPTVQLVIVGDPRVAKLFDGYNVEFMLGVEFEAWPEMLNSLRLDIGIAPLRDTEFCKCKSNIKWLEYSVAQISGIYSPTVYFRRGFEPDMGFIARTSDDWYNQLKVLIQNPVLRQDIAFQAYTMVTARYSLEKHIGEWEDFYEDLTASQK